MDRPHNYRGNAMSNKKKVKDIVLRDYQEECIKAIDEAGAGHYLVAMATGLGKTAIFTHLENPGRTLIISHRDELVRQPEKYYKGRKTFGVEKADEHAGDEDVISASVQSLQQDKRLQSFAKDAFDTIIVDEAHHAAADSYRKIINHFSGARRVIGFTATPKRGDNVGLDSVFDKIIFTRDIRWGIENGYLSRIRCKQVRSNYSLSGITMTAGDYSASAVEKMMSQEGVDIIPVAAKTYLEDCYEKGRHTLIYCVTRDACTVVLNTIQKMLPAKEKNTVKVITGVTPDEERAKTLADFQKGKVKCIINCMVLTEGTDLPICDTIINLRPTCNMSLYQQIVGRGTRTCDGKDYCLVLDIVPKDSSIHRTLCTAPTLFGIDPFLLDKDTVQKLNEKEDLMDLCNGLSEAFATLSQKIELQRNTVDLFVEETEELIQNAAESGIKKVADDYFKLEKKKQAENADIDFGNLDVKIQADEERYYSIKPNWDEEIFMSKPDILNMVRVEFDLERGRILCGTVKLETALSMIHSYCETMPWYFGYSWNKDMQDEWLNTDSTDAQKGTVRKLYSKMNVNLESMPKVSKLEASRLIDLAKRLKEAKKYSEALALYNSPKQTQKVKKAKEVVDQAMDKRKSIEVNGKEFDNFRKMLESLEEKKKSEEEREAARLKEIAEHGGYVEAVITTESPENMPATENQIEYIRGLYSAAIRSGRKITGGVPKSLTRRQAGAIISLFRKINYSREYKGMDFGDIWESSKRAEAIKVGPIAFHYTLAKKSE